MGMTEMELAIEVMLDKAESRGIDISSAVFWHEDFEGNESAMVGFCQLLLRGWMKSGNCNSEFKVHDALRERLHVRGLVP